MALYQGIERKYFNSTVKLPLSDFLVGKEYRFEAIEKALKQIKVSEYIHNLTNEDFLALLFS